MEERLDFYKASPGGFKAMVGLQEYVNDCGREHSLMELVKMRATRPEPGPRWPAPTGKGY